MFEHGEEIVTVTMTTSKLEGLVKAGLLKDGSYVISSVRIHGENYEFPEFKEAKSEYIKAKKKLEDLTYKLRHGL